MMIRGLLLVLLAALNLSLLACAEEIEPGVNCSSDVECATEGIAFACFCRKDPIPGVCSTGCMTDADCAFLGDGYTCRIDFCPAILPNVNICLRSGVTE